MTNLKSAFFFLWILLLTGSATQIRAQVAINESGNQANSKSMLDISSTSKGLLIPRMTTAERTTFSTSLGLSETSMLVFDTDENIFYFWNGTSFTEIKSGMIDKIQKSNGDSEVKLVNQDGSDIVVVKLDNTDYFRFQQGGLEILNNGKSVFIGEGAGENDDFSDNFNTFVGYHSGQANSTGSQNTSLGTYAISANSTGFNNLALGYASMQNSTTGYSNIGLGAYSLFNNLTASGNTGLGNYSLYSLTIGIENTVLGSNGMKQLENGYYNTAVGKSAGYRITNGSSNTLVGFETGYGSSPHTINGCVFLGHKAGYYETADNKLYIENSNSSTPLIGGDFLTDEVYINGTLKITGGNPNQGKYLVSDTLGNAVWDSITFNQFKNVIDNDTNVYIGYMAGQKDEGDNYNVGIGRNASFNNQGGAFNIAIGNESLYWNSSGTGNTAVGCSALNTNVASYNTALGLGALRYNYSGDYNTAVGAFASRDNNTGWGNVSIGYASSFLNMDGNKNTTIGFQSGHGPATHTKSGCVFIGFQAGFNETGDDKLYIENSNSSIPLIGGDFSTDEVYINGTLKITGGNPGQGKYLLSDTSGTASWDSLSMNQLENVFASDTSIFIGLESGLNDDGNNFNYGFGLHALKNILSGGHNIAIGFDASYDNETGSQNTAIGNYALYTNTSNFNIAIGTESLRYNTSGSSNTAIGRAAAYHNTIGVENVCIGSSSSSNNQEGSGNTTIGYNSGAGSSLHSKSGCVFIGYQSGYYETGDDKLYIENSSSTSPLIGGDFSTDEVYINGTIKITGGNPGAGKLLTSDASGNASWQANTAPTELKDLSDADYDGSSLFVGDQAGVMNGTNKFNAGFGKDALTSNTSGAFNTALGTRPMFNNTTSDNNTAVGYNPLYNNTTGASNTAIGSSTMYNNNGSENTAVGFESLYTNSTGNKNTSIGVQAMYGSSSGNENTAVGYRALNVNTTGYKNTVLGSDALLENTDGSQNVAIGTSSGSLGNNTKCTYVGVEAMNTTQDNWTNSTALGFNTSITASNQVRIGNSSVTSIGGYAAWTNISDRRFKSDVRDDISGLDFILKLRPVSYQLDVEKLNAFLGMKGSDEKAGNNKSGIRQTGFIAQEVEQIAKQIGFDFSGIDKPKNEGDHYGLRYSQFVVPLVKAVQEQQEIIETQLVKIESLEKRLSVLEELMSK